MRKPDRRPTSTAAIALAACLASGGLTACDGKSEATPPPPTQSIASATPSPTPSKPPPPPLPATAKGLTIESAEAFTRYYLSLLDYAKRSREVTPLRTWSEPGCIRCKGLLRAHTDVFSAGGSFTGDFFYKNFSSTDIRLNRTKAATVTFRATLGKRALIARRGAKPKFYQAQALRWTMTLISRNGQWIAYEIEEA